jgi:hypothetical protein
LFLLLLPLVEELETAGLQLALEALELERGELVRLEELVQLDAPDRPAGLGRVEQWPKLLLKENGLDDVDCHGRYE